MFGIDIEVLKVIGTIIAGLLGGGFTAYILLPGLIRKYRAEARNLETETAERALEMADKATKKVQELMVQNESILSTLSGDFEMTTEFSLVEVIKHGETTVTGRIRKVIQPAAQVT